MSYLPTQQGYVGKYTSDLSPLIGLSFEIPHLIKGLNLMIAKSTKYVKSTDFNADFAVFADFTDFAGINVVFQISM